MKHSLFYRTQSMRIWIFLLYLGISSFLIICPHQATADIGQGSNTYQTNGLRRQIATIAFAGLAGAALGISTLSFYDNPQGHLSNISIGLALGVILGAGYVTYQSATLSQHLPPSEEADKLFALNTRRSSPSRSKLLLGPTFTFEF